MKLSDNERRVMMDALTVLAAKHMRSADADDGRDRYVAIELKRRLAIADIEVRSVAS